MEGESWLNGFSVGSLLQFRKLRDTQNIPVGIFENHEAADAYWLSPVACSSVRMSSSHVRVGNQYIADERIEIRTSGNELAESSPRRTVGVEFFD
jgi:hypothetical protein